MKADGLNMSMLTRAEQFARAADFQIPHRNRIARAELCVLSDDLESLLTFERRGKFSVAEKVRIGARRSPSDPAAQLIELSEAKRVGTVNDQCVRVRNVQPRFNDGRREQNIHIARVEAMHHIGEFMLRHLAVAHIHMRFGHELIEMRLHRIDGVDAIMHEENLSTAFEFAQDGLPHQLRRIGANVRDDGQTFLGRCVEIGNIAHAGERHI